MRPRGILFPFLGILLLLAVFLGSARRSYAADAEPGRTLTILGLGHGKADLDGPWQFHTGDDLAWAQSAWDDSGWESLAVDAPWGTQGHASYTGMAWYRLHLKIIPAPGAEGKFQILLPDAEDSYEVYWNGNLIGTYGHLPPHPVWFYSVFPRSFPITGATSGVLAIRVWKAPLEIFSIAEGGGVYATPVIGDAETISLYERAITWHYIQLELFEYSLVLLRVFITALCLVLWSHNRREKFCSSGSASSPPRRWLCTCCRVCS